MSEADKMFEELGFKITENEKMGIQYTKRDSMSEMKRVGFIVEKFIEFYHQHKEILIYTNQCFKDGQISRWDTSVIKMQELKAINQKCKEMRMAR